MKKQILACFLVILTAFVPLLGGCGKESDQAKAVYLAVSGDAQKTLFEKAAKKYKDETGKTVKIKTFSEKTDGKIKVLDKNTKTVSIFAIENNSEFEKLKDYCEDITDSRINSYLSDRKLSLRSDDGKKTYAVPLEISGHGIVYNKDIIDKYFKLQKSEGEITSIAQVRDFKSLKRLVEGLNAKKDELGINSVFASPSLKGEDAFDWHSGILNVPFYYEFSGNEDYDAADRAFMNSKEIDFRYDKEYKDLLDLITANSTDKASFASKSNEDALSEFSQNRAAMIIGDDGILKDTKNKDGQRAGLLPLYLDISGNKNQGITIKRKSYLAVNKKADKADKTAALEFLDWLVSSKQGKKILSEDMGTLTPFNTFEEGDLPDDPLKKETGRYMNDSSLENVLWVITEPIRDITKGKTATALSEYMRGEKTFDQTKETVKDGFKMENR